MPLIDEHVRSVGREVHELARLHGELARTEASEGARKLAIGLCLFVFGVTVGTAALLAAGVALFLSLASVMARPLAAALVAAGFLGLMLLIWFIGWRVVRGSHALTLPRTRQMIWELLRWRDEPSDS